MSLGMIEHGHQVNSIKKGWFITGAEQGTDPLATMSWNGT
jgi:hypothetical protein